MYKGNMKEFIDNLNIYLKENKMGFLNYPTKSLRDIHGIRYYMVYYNNNYVYSFNVYDTEDFEEQIYKFLEDYARKGK